MARPDRIDNHHARECLGKALGKSSGKRGRAGRACLRGGADLQRHAGIDRLAHRLDPFGGEPQGRDRMNDDRHAEWLFAECAGAAERNVEHLDHRPHMAGGIKAHADGLAGGFKAGKGRVDVEVERCLHIPGDNRPDAIMDMLRAVDDPHEPVKVGEGGGAVGPRSGIKHLHSGPAGADMDPAATDLETKLLDKARKGDGRG